MQESTAGVSAVGRKVKDGWRGEGGGGLARQRGNYIDEAEFLEHGDYLQEFYSR